MAACVRGKREPGRLVIYLPGAEPPDAPRCGGRGAVVAVRWSRLALPLPAAGAGVLEAAGARRARPTRAAGRLGGPQLGATKTDCPSPCRAYLFAVGTRSKMAG
jgi:hypothetical protein